jgi:hypothetical protein
VDEREGGLLRRPLFEGEAVDEDRCLGVDTAHSFPGTEPQRELRAGRRMRCAASSHLQLWKECVELGRVTCQARCSACSFKVAKPYIKVQLCGPWPRIEFFVCGRPHIRGHHLRRARDIPTRCSASQERNRKRPSSPPDWRANQAAPRPVRLRV